MKNIVFMGTPDFSVPILQQLHEAHYDIALVVTQPDRPKGRKKVMTAPPVKKEAERLGLPVFQPEQLKTDYQKIIDAKPDLIVTAAYGQILPLALLDFPSYGCINVHASLLPELRGGAPIHYAIIEGKKKTGVTIMYMAEKLDAGDILTQQEVEISLEADVESLHNSLSEVGSELLLETLPKLLNHELERIPQDEEKATFAPNITREVERIDWQKPQQTIYDLIRGLRPWPVSFTTYKNKIMKIWTSVLGETYYDAAPGENVAVEDDYFVVACGDGLGIKITEIQPAGKKRMFVKDYLRGSKERIQLGVILDEKDKE